MGSTNSVFSFALTNTSKAFESMKEAHEKKKRAKLHMAIKFDKWCRYSVKGFPKETIHFITL